MSYLINDFFEDMKKLVISYVGNNYDYCYLDAMHEKNRQFGTKTIITGCSYARDGIMEKYLMGDVINFSLASQDLYYDFLNIKKACEEGKQTIENCLINIGYYSLFLDLSLSKNIIHLVKSVYEPLFHDTHHLQIDSPYDPLQKMFESGKEFFSKELFTVLCREWSRSFFMEQSSYYGDVRTRSSKNAMVSEGNDWRILSESERESYARSRASDHNRLAAHKETRIENAKLIEEMVEYLSKKNTRTIFIVLPLTKWYMQYLDPQYKKDIYQLLDQLELPIELFDMNELDCFSDNDFADADHLNDRGAEKASLLLNDFLNC